MQKNEEDRLDIMLSLMDVDDSLEWMDEKLIGKAKMLQPTSTTYKLIVIAQKNIRGAMMALDLARAQLSETDIEED